MVQCLLNETIQNERKLTWGKATLKQLEEFFVHSVDIMYSFLYLKVPYKAPIFLDKRLIVL